jgi:hypothetical protein
MDIDIGREGCQGRLIMEERELNSFHSQNGCEDAFG